MNFKKISTCLTTLIFAVFAAINLIPAGSAQNKPEMIVTWEAQTYAPNGFGGRILPSSNSKIKMALSLITNGKPADLSRFRINWFINNEQQETGVGKTNIEFFSPQTNTGDLRIKAVVLNFLGQNQEKSITIPITKPEIVIDSPFQNGIGAGNFPFKALPYFFNIEKLSELEMTWGVNGEEVREGSQDQDILDLKIPQGFGGGELKISLTAVNIKSPLEIASVFNILKVK